MTTDSGATPSRFRTATVTLAAAPADRVVQLADQPDALREYWNDTSRQLAAAGDWRQLADTATAAAQATDDTVTAFHILRGASVLLNGIATSMPADDSWTWAQPIDATVALLMPQLERTPHEPVLLDLLGVAVYELGHTSLARRIFEAVRDMDSETPRVREHLRAAKRRMQQVGDVGQRHVPEEATPHFAAARARIKPLLERAVRLPDARISLCMIVKDEEEMLPDCLAAVAPFVDEMIVVDTGSSDRTRDIARDAGATVVEFAWTGSFSDARNESLRHASGDWVLYLDADEHLVDGDGPRLRELARHSWLEGINLVETHFMGDADGSGSTQATHTPLRMWRRREGREWRGIVHEQVAWCLPTWCEDRIRQSSVRIDHYGYLARVVDDRDKHERNLQLLMEQYQDGDRSAFTLFNIGTEYSSLGQWVESLSWFDTALETLRRDAYWTEQQFAPLLVQRTVVSRRMNGQSARAHELIDKALATWPEYTDLVFERASVHLADGEFEAAADAARRALAMGDAPARFVAITGKGSFQANVVLATALRRLGDFDGSVAQLEAATDAHPQYLTAIIELADMLLASGAAPREVDERIDALLGADRAGATAPNLLLGAVFHAAGAFDVADARYERVLAQHPDNASALAARAELRLFQHRFDDAYELGLSLDPSDVLAAPAARTSFIAAVAQDQPERLDVPLARMLESDTLPASERAVYVAWDALLDPSHNVVAFVPQDDGAVQTLMTNLEALARVAATDAFERSYPLVAQVIPDERARRMQLAELYLRLRFADMAGEELIHVAERFGPDASVLLGLGKVATIKSMWDDAEVFLSESLEQDPDRRETRLLLAAVRERTAV